MSQQKYALLRYRTIDNCLKRTYRSWSLLDLQSACTDALREVYGDYQSEKERTISERTIHYDLSAMKMEYEAPIDYNRARKSYYYTDPNYSITNCPLHSEDLKLLRETVATLQQFGEFPLFRELQGLVSKVEQKVSLKAGPAAEVICFEQVPNYKGAEYLQPLYRAIVAQTVLEITYQPFTAPEAFVCTVHPYLLKEYNQRWFLLALEEKRQCIQLYALDRLQGISPTAEPYRPNTTVQANTFFQHVIGVSIPEGAQSEEVLLHFQPKRAPYVLTKPLHATQQRVQHDAAGLVVQLNVIVNRELEAELLSFGPDVRVLQPLALANKLRELHHNAWKAYESASQEQLTPLL
jgi:predicted DNA-binding transcriptional regulator YafY